MRSLWKESKASCYMGNAILKLKTLGKPKVFFCRINRLAKSFLKWYNEKVDKVGQNQ